MGDAQSRDFGNEKAAEFRDPGIRDPGVAIPIGARHASEVICVTKI